MHRLLIPVLALVLSACDQEAMFEKFVPKEEAALAKQVIFQLTARDFASVEAQLDPSLRSPDLRSKLDEMAKQVPSGEPMSIRTVGAHTNTTNSITRFDLTFEYQYKDTWLVANAVLERRDGKVVVQGIHFTPRTRSLEAENAFTLAGKSALHYAVLALAVAIPLLVVYALIVCVRTKVPKRKWLWLLFVAVGLVQFQFNWTTGAWGIQPLSFALLGAGFFKAGPVAPYIFTLAFPLGALVFLKKRRSYAQRVDA
ncbi:hypothetical protein [uncultured Methylibium sp.]|uniref:hypothetical protein n=1 Tax=uncultured Methylibium sp. TaxID=381093 RepID=UPI0025E75CCE|nr:hypothetical protein [uncultured Methylibium sp.]